MPMPYMGQSFPSPRNSRPGGFAFRLLGGLADTKRMMLGHELTKDLIYTRSAADAASTMITDASRHQQNLELENVKSGNQKALETHRTSEINTRASHQGEVDKDVFNQNEINRTNEVNARVTHQGEVDKDVHNKNARATANAEVSAKRRGQKIDIKTMQAVTAAARGNQWEDDGTTIDPNLIHGVGDISLQARGNVRDIKKDKN